MKLKSIPANNSILENDYEEEGGDSDRELEIAFAKGILKPGLNKEVERRKFTPINNIEGLKKKLIELKLKLPWLETLICECEPAPLAPELALQLENQKGKTFMNTDYGQDDLVYNDFSREMMFYRLGQAAVLEGIPRLNKIGVPTKRPEDYFAEMAKTDQHMHKVRQKIKVKENAIIIREKAKKMRDLKKYGKKVQVERQLQRQEEKRTILEELKKYRKGKTNSLAFLGETAEKADASTGLMKSKKQLKEELNAIDNRRRIRDKKFGVSGRKKGWKRTTAKDLDGPVDSAGHKISHKPQKMLKKKQMNKRPGKKSREIAMHKKLSQPKKKQKK